MSALPLIRDTRAVIRNCFDWADHDMELISILFEVRNSNEWEALIGNDEYRTYQVSD